MNEVVKLERHDVVAIVTVNSPPVNALSAAVRGGILECIKSAIADPQVKAIVLTCAGRTFIAGADINEVATDTPVEAEAKTRRGHDLMDLIENLDKPEVAAVNGFALGGGCEAALACTIRLASDSAKFGLPEVKLGIIPGYGGTQRLPRLVGKGVAMQLILSGAMIDATEAHLVGLVNEVIPGAELISRAEAILNQIGANAPLSVKYAIEAVNKGTEASLAEGLVLESTLVAICTSTEDKKEGTAAFLEKRAAKFNGR